MADKHPVPWSLRTGLHLDPAPHWDSEETAEGFKLMLGSRVGGGTYGIYTRAELRLLRDQLDAVLLAPFRMLVAGGDVVNASTDWPEIYEWLDVQRARVDHAGVPMQIVCGAENPAQSMVYVWALNNRIELVGQRPVDFTAGGNAVMLMPDSDGRAIAGRAHKLGIPVYRAAPHRLWGGGRG